MASVYNWAITRDYIDNGAETGLTGPRNFTPHTANETAFRLYDDDGGLYYAGKMWGDFEGFEPLDDFGTPNAGCTEIKLRDSDGIFRTV